MAENGDADAGVTGLTRKQNAGIDMLQMKRAVGKRITRGSARGDSYCADWCTLLFDRYVYS